MAFAGLGDTRWSLPMHVRQPCSSVDERVSRGWSEIFCNTAVVFNPFLTVPVQPDRSSISTLDNLLVPSIFLVSD